jgi:transglutaminase-like putative cysteine protease
MKAARTTANPDLRWWDALGAILLLCALLTAATRLVVTQWTEDLYTIQTLTFLGGVLGLALGQSRLSGRLSFFLALGYGMLLTLWNLGAPMSWQIPWKERLMIMGQRLQITFDQLLKSQPVNDNIFFLLLMTLLFWTLAVTAGYSITRRAASWRAVIPTGVALMVIHTYDPLITRRSWFLAAYLLFSLLLVARMHYSQQRVHWRKNRTYVPPDIGFDWIRFTLGAALLLIVFAWTAPALADAVPAARSAWQKVKHPWDEFTERTSNMFTSLQATVGIVHEQYGNTLALGRGTELTDTLVMSIEAPPRQMPGQRYYWRAFAYDYYEAGKWQSTLEEAETVFPTERTLTFPDTTGRVISTFNVIPQNAIVTLYTPSQPVWVDVPYRPQLAVEPDGTVDLVALNSTAIIMPGQPYEVRASLVSATVADLREAGTDYPEWILERYTQLPPEITPATHELAAKISEGLESPYDIVTSVTEFLRAYEYRETIPAPPANRELIDWWLFEYQAGFCQYYATAHVVLLRSLGIPARLAVGYAQGEYEGRGVDTVPVEGLPDPEDFTDQGGIYRIRARNAHAWPEVYFPGIGWVEFEPTASENPIARQSGVNNPNLPRSVWERDLEALEQERLRMLLDDPLDEFETRPIASLEEQNTGISYFLVTAPLILALAVVYLWRRRQPALNLTPLPIRLERSLRRFGINPPSFLKRWSYYASQSPFTTAYLEINRALRRLGSPPSVDDTPAERARDLAKLIPQASDSVYNLLEQYQLSIYSRRPTDVFAARRSAAEIRKLSFQAFFRALIGKKDEIFSRVQR